MSEDIKHDCFMCGKRGSSTTEGDEIICSFCGLVRNFKTGAEHYVEPSKLSKSQGLI